MGYLYFVRHGETVWNVENKICGATDSPLTEKGHQQAIETGKIIRDAIKRGEIMADEIWCSPLSRAYDTAKHISDLTGIPVIVEPRLTEQCFGKWEGTPRDGLEFRRDKENFVSSYGGGESMLRLAQRIYNVLDEAKALSEEKTIMIVAHNGIARVIRSYFYDMTNEEYAAFGIKNCQVMKYKF